MDWTAPQIVAAIITGAVALVLGIAGGIRWFVARRDGREAERVERLRSSYVELQRWADELPDDRPLSPPPEPAARLVRNEGSARARRSLEELARLYAVPMERQSSSEWVTEQHRWSREFHDAVASEFR